MPGVKRELYTVELRGICSLSDGQEWEFQDAGGHPRSIVFLIAARGHLTETEDLVSTPLLKIFN